MSANFLNSDERLPLYQQLRDEILAKISAGEWLPGKPIPTEAELTRRYGVAVGTVRKAVETLVAEGLLERSQGRGTFVRRPDFHGSFFRFFRQVSSSGQQQVPKSRVLSQQQEKADERVSRALALDLEAAVIRLDRLRVLESGGLIREQIWLPEHRFAPLLDIEPEQFGNLLYPFYEQRCGQIVASAQETLSVEAADAGTAEAIGIAPGEPVAVIERVALGYDRSPLEYRLSRGAATHFRYRIEIS